jgi:hypothetical protein
MLGFFLAMFARSSLEQHLNIQPRVIMEDGKIQPQVTQVSDSDSGRSGTRENLDEKTATATDITETNINGTLIAGHLDHSNPFSDPAVAEHYRELYEKSQYESRGAFDPTLEWTKEEERKLIRKLDWHVCLWAVSVAEIRRRTVADQPAFSVSCSLLSR